MIRGGLHLKGADRPGNVVGDDTVELACYRGNGMDVFQCYVHTVRSLNEYRLPRLRCWEEW